MTPPPHRRCRHHHHPHHRWHDRFRHKRKLQRRIFIWSGASIVFTALIVILAFRLMSPTERLQQDAAGFERFVSARFDAVWDNPEARDALLEDMHEDLRLDVALRDAHGALITQIGESCSDTPWGAPGRGGVAVVHLRHRDGTSMGELEACGEPYEWGGWRFGVVLLIAITVLWAAAGVLARLMLRPLRKLETMARRIADGDLNARSALNPGRDGELGVLGQTMDEMVARIEKQLTDQRELLAAVSHELRTPLGHLRLLLEMARDKPTSALVDEIESEVLEIDALVGQLLASSRVDFGTLQTKAVDAVELARRALSRADLPEELLEVEGAEAMIEADPTLLARALANLLTNARQHGGGVRRVIVQFLADEVVFAVEDDGPGIAPAERARVFEAFYRGEHRAGTSLGLGLSLVSRIAQAHGGRAWIADSGTGGARVAFSLSAEES